MYQKKTEIKLQLFKYENDLMLQDHVEYFRSKFGKKPLKKSYFKHAMEHFRDECETEKIAFLYVSDDMEWGKQELAKVQKKHQDIFFDGK